MDSAETAHELPQILEEILGYLNFSSGASDPKFLRNFNELFRHIEGNLGESADSWQTACGLLDDRLNELTKTSPAFRDIAQASAVLELLRDRFVNAYREFHRDLLFHQPPGAIERPYFLAKACESLLAEGAPWDDAGRIVDGAIARLNDFIGYRPVAVLRTTQRIEPYRHEWVAPVPLFVRGAGVAVGRYQKLIEAMFAILEQTDPDLLAQAQFDPELLDELSLDPRAYDFDHPANKRPNYHFGQWDPHRIDNKGNYRRFILQQVTLDALLLRVEHPGELKPAELLVEAAAALCGTMLMASGTSGSGPDVYDSNLSLATLAPRIAAYRDVFYQQLLARLSGKHADRLRAEAKSGRQPLAGARQHLNHYLARRRAAQLEHVHLAQLFARMGYADAARRQAHVVPVASARMICEIQCRLTTGHHAIGLGELEQAAGMLGEIGDYLQRGIECGALVDPWSILGFQGQFSLFPSPENSISDHRVEQLIGLLEQIFGLYARLWTEGAARNDSDLTGRLSKEMRELAGWWDKFASTTVESVESFSGVDAYDSARRVAEALQAWHQGGAAAADIGFWRKHATHFNSPKAYALVAEALLDKGDIIAAMALLVQWLSQADEIALKHGEHSFHRLARCWLEAACATVSPDNLAAQPTGRRDQVVKFFDYLEANAEDYWQVPRLELQSSASRAAARPDDEELTADGNADEGDEPNLYAAAYDEVVYVDSTGDGVDADMLESGEATDSELELEARRIHEHLAFLTTIASLWKSAALRLRPPVAAPPGDEVLRRWREAAQTHEADLLRLLDAVHRQTIPAPTANRESLLEYDRRRTVKEALLEDVISAAVASSDSIRFLRALGGGHSGETAAPAASNGGDVLELVFRAAQRNKLTTIRERWPELLAAVRGQTLLYIPQSRGGDPRRVVQARSVQQTIRELLLVLPRLGLLRETCQLIEATRLAEAEHVLPGGAVSEFDRQFESGYRALVESLATVSGAWSAEIETSANEAILNASASSDAADSTGESTDMMLVECLEQMTESLLKQWLAHSRNLRLSVLEKVRDDDSWAPFVAFVERYGHDLFTQRFLNFGNLRAILHQGVDNWLTRLQEDDDAQLALLDDLDRGIARAEAVKQLELAIEAVLECYSEYRDYNSTTTQSDRGELLYTLLDFLRLRVQYDRIAWHLRPVLMAHEMLVRRGRDQAAEMWRRALAERTSEIADTLQKRLGELERKYAMRIPTVADRIAERFVRPLAIDRMRALVRPAVDEAGGSEQPTSFKLLEQEAEDLCQVPSGAGLDAPPWLAALEQELERVQQPEFRSQGAAPAASPPQAPLSLSEVQAQLAEWEVE